MAQPIVNDNRRAFPKNRIRRNKLEIKFDENARREFLTGFHKRKVQKKQKALEVFEQKLKEEKRRIKSEAKDAYKKLLLLQKPVCEADLHSEEIDMGTHSVSVTELSASELAKRNNWIGVNEVQYEDRAPTFNHSRAGDDDDDADGSDLEGMELKKRGKDGKMTFMKNSKLIKKMLQQQSTFNVKNSKIFQKQSKIARIRHLKRKKKEEKKRKKLQRQKMNANNN